jgi:hypothetical protein
MPLNPNESTCSRIHKSTINTAAIILLLNSFVIQAQIEELTLKALFLEAAIRFINWPDTKENAGTKKSIFVVGVFPHDKMISYLEKTFSAKKVKNKAVRFLEIDNVDKISGCDLIFIPSSQKGNIRIICEVAGKLPVLTVSDSPDLTGKGVILSLGIEKSRIACYINETEASKAGFKISHHLMQKSTVVSNKEQ